MKILIIKTGALGDVVRCTFLAQALKDKYSKYNPEIFWLTSELATSMFINNPYVDHILTNKGKYKEYLKKHKFSLIVNLEESEELCRLTTELRPKKIQGFFLSNNKILPTKSIEEWFNMSAIGPKPQNDILKMKNKKNHRQLMSEIIKVDPKKYEPFLRLTKTQRQIVGNFLRRHNLSRKDLIVGINTGGADRWPKSLSIKKTAQLIDKIYKKFNAKILLFGGSQQIERNRDILKLLNSPVIDTGCGNDLIEFPALISVCNLMITSDTLGLHIALALKRKTICLVGPTSNTELGMYGLGEKVIPKSNCLCCYNSDCKSMDKINIDEVVKHIDKLSSQKITLLITAFKEPLTIGNAIESALNQKTEKQYQILVSAPDKETLDIAKKYQEKHKNIKIFQDPGKGKSYALNMIFNKIDTDILILTDGDVFISDNVIEDISNLFLDPEVGCVTGRPVPTEKRNSMFGYWANFLFDSAHRLRSSAHKINNFLECSGYLFAFRKKFINEIPLDVAEDTVIPYYFWQKGYKIGYSPESKVFIKNVDNWNDWINQKTRTSKSHETLEKYVDIKTTPRVKTFKTEAKGVTWLLSYPNNFKEFYWSFLLALSRLYMWVKVFGDTRLKNRHYNDAWERVESTK